ncbi:RICIN domain-containing protein [Streptomyces sp. 8N616]|uniref:RICIN domain-containing protein n=1 Tax=Streptomyces sp. 8N616 TaxID=3457414 RepID=UPI003FD4D1FD
MFHISRRGAGKPRRPSAAIPPRSRRPRPLGVLAAVLAGTALTGCAAGLTRQDGRAETDDRPSAVAPAEPTRRSDRAGTSGAPGAGLSLLSDGAGGKCLTAIKIREQVRPEAAECGSWPTQSWSADQDGTGPHRLRNRATNACLTFTPPSSSHAPAPAPSLQVCRAHDGWQHFHFFQFGNWHGADTSIRHVRVVNAASGRALEVGPDGTSILQGGPYASPHQGWLMLVTTYQ